MLLISRKFLLIIVVAALLAACGGSETALDEGNPLEADGQLSEDPNQTPGDGGTDNPAVETPTDNTGETAIEIYEQQCAMCHGADGKGGFAGGELHNCDTCGSEEELFETILATMPLANAQMCDSDCSRKLAQFIFNDFDEATGGINDPVLPAPTTVPTPIVTPLPSITPVPSPTMTPPVTPSPVVTPTPVSLPGLDGFTYCSEESSRPWAGEAGQVMCEFSGTREVAFGANGNYYYLTATESIECSYEVFGDPLPGVTKACYISAIIGAPVPTPSPTPAPTVTPTITPTPIGDICAQPKPTSLSSSYSTQQASLTCSACHGPSGLGGIGPNLHDMTQKSIAAFESVVRSGKGDMPAFSASSYPQTALQNDFAYFNHDHLCGEPPKEEVSCAATEELLKPQLRRLTQAQFVNTIASVFGNDYHNTVGQVFDDGIPTIGMSNNANVLGINEVNLENIYSAIQAVIDRLMNNQLNACLTGSGNNCINNLVNQYGQPLWRRPLTSEEQQAVATALSRIRNQGASRRQQMEFAIRSLMLSPNFLFRTELGVLQNGTPEDNSQLNSYEIASLLSYSIWDSPPDQTLYDLAATNQLQSQQIIDQQVERMVSDSRFEDVMLRFYKDFLKLDRILSVNKLPEVGLTNNVRQSLLASVEMTLRDSLAGEDPDIMDMFIGNEFYANNAIASFLGLDSAQFGNSLSPVVMDNQQRNGILTHPAFLSVHASEGGSGIVKRGVFVLEQLLCAHLGQPPNELTEQPLPEDINPNNTSTRELLRLQHSSQTACIGCHQVIDPAGFGFEHFDTAGRYRTHEKNNVPIDSSGTLANVVANAIIFDNHVDYVDGLLFSEEMRICVTRRLLESIGGQNLTADSCELQVLRENTNDGNVSIRDLVRTMMRLESIRMRSWGENE